MSAQDKLTAALRVFLLDKFIRRILDLNDPKAVEQAIDALGGDPKDGATEWDGLPDTQTLVISNEPSPNCAFTVYGPFQGSTLAVSWATEHLRPRSWWLTPLKTPGPFSVFSARGNSG